jgi:hypothetical protein
MLTLPDVTLVCIDGAYHDLSALAMQTCLKHATFGDVMTFSDRPILREAANMMCRINSLDDAMRVLWYTVPQVVKTSHFLVMQWDSWIINPQQWFNEFLAYDYIGAPWGYPHYNIGNGGFSLRSTRLARFLAGNKLAYPIHHPEDDWLCRMYRHGLETKGFRWPPDDMALRFSFECTGPVDAGKHFGFHCLRNFPYVMKREELAERLYMCPDSIKRSNDYAIAVKLGQHLGSQCGAVAV